MTGHERMLVHQLSIAGAQIERLRREVAELDASNANLCVERDATDLLLGEAMDLLAESDRKQGGS
jgi:hypothetical protein